DLAYITLKEMLYSPLTLVIGRQNLAYGRHLIIGNGLWRNPGLSLEYQDLSVLHGYDAIRAILDYDPWTVDIVYIKNGEADNTQNMAWFPATWGADRDSDWDIYGLNVGYVWQGDIEGEVEAYGMYDRNETFNMVVGNIPGSPNRQAIFDDSRIICGGMRGSCVPYENLTLGAEVAGQWGEITAKDGPRPQNAAGAMETLERDRQAMLANAFGEYTFADVRLTPVVGVEYLYTSGEEAENSGDYESWDFLGRGHKMGTIRDCLETVYTTKDIADTSGFTNQHTVKAMCGLDLGELVDGLSLDLAYLHYWFDEVPSIDNQDDDIGDEINMTLTYDYTEDVEFVLDGAWFIPGDYYDQVHIWMPAQGDLNVGGDLQPFGAGQSMCANDMAISVIGSCKVSF
ncbi:MAG: alginate export family protein, partial [Candidatus Omnitrophica bacterium]|nr:alginate export family protein [Candidatus Omnitrophota bacterium]